MSSWPSKESRNVDPAPRTHSGLHHHVQGEAVVSIVESGLLVRETDEVLAHAELDPGLDATLVERIADESARAGDGDANGLDSGVTPSGPPARGRR